MSKKGFKLNVGFITGVFAVCAVSIATGYFLKNGSISASTTAGTVMQDYANGTPVGLAANAVSWLFGGSNEMSRTCAASTGIASADPLPLTDQEKERYGDTAKAYLVKINGKISEFRLVISASRVNDANDSNPNNGKQTDVMVEYTLTYLFDPRLPNAESRGGNGDNITLIYNGVGIQKVYNTLVKNDPWEDFVKFRDAYTYYENTGKKDFKVSVHFKGKHNDGCVANINLKDALVASITTAPLPVASLTATSIASTGASASSTVTSAVKQSVAVAVKQSVAVTEINNFRGCYYTGRDFDKFAGARNDKIDYSWGGGPATTKTGNENFSARWAGDFKTTYADEYVFNTVSDDGVRVWVNNSLIIDAWTKGKKKSEGKIKLPVGKFPIKVEYYEEVGNAEISLTWKSTNTVKTPNALAKVTHNSDYRCEGQPDPTVSATPTVSVSPDPSAIPTVGYDYAGDEKLNMSLKVEPIHGKLPLTVNATANLNGTATGKVTWKMYCGDKLPNDNAVVGASKQLTDNSTTQTLSCTYNQKRSFRLFVIAKREGVSVTTKVWVKAGFLPLGENQERVSIDLKKGFNVFGSDKVAPALRFQNAGGLTIFRYNYWNYKKWLRWPEQKVNYNLIPGKGYYLYSPKDQTAKVVMRTDVSSVDDRRLFSGWNMVWVKDASEGLKGVKAMVSTSDSKDTDMNKGTNKCVVEKQDLQELVDKGVAYKYVYVIANGNATEACSTFKLLETGSTASSCNKVNAAQTATPTSKCTACSLDIVNSLSEGDIFWIYIYDSKLRQARGLGTVKASATATVTPSITSLQAATISLTGDMCK